MGFESWPYQILAERHGTSYFSASRCLHCHVDLKAAPPPPPGAEVRSQWDKSGDGSTPGRHGENSSSVNAAVTFNTGTVTVTVKGHLLRAGLRGQVGASDVFPAPAGLTWVNAGFNSCCTSAPHLQRAGGKSRLQVQVLMPDSRG